MTEEKKREIYRELIYDAHKAVKTRDVKDWEFAYGEIWMAFECEAITYEQRSLLIESLHLWVEADGEEQFKKIEWEDK